ncbi:HAMP domain-containing histidine kinase [Candidatus Woesearchaeota archaeon]|nr:HAMP domain-containing histidine kinase [Candidatus Woesearchaeota archaeon]
MEETTKQKKNLDNVMLEISTYFQEKIQRRTQLLTRLKTPGLKTDEIKTYTNLIFKDAEQQIQKIDELYSDIVPQYEEKSLNRDMVRGLFHDLRNPLNRIMGFSTLYTDEARKDFLEQIEEGNKDQQNMIQSTLESLKQGRQTYNLQTENLTDIVHKTEKNAKFLIDQSKTQGKQLELRTNYQITENTEIETDKVILERILDNLITNAIKYTEKGTIELGVQDLDEKIQFYVKDTGTGIDSHDVQKIFNPYFKSNNQEVNTTNIKSYGVGLSIVKRCVEGLRGKLDLETELGKGSTFYVTLPKTNFISYAS